MKVRASVKKIGAKDIQARRKGRLVMWDPRKPRNKQRQG